jgi:hypothetical protein
VHDAQRIREVDVQNALWDVFEFPDARDATIDALLRLLPAKLAVEFRGNVRGRVWAWRVAAGRFGPDIVLVDTDDEVLMVIELKLRAAENVLRAATVDRGLSRTAAAGVLVSRESAARVANELGVHGSRFHTAHGGSDCECPWHMRVGVGEDGEASWVRSISQFDAYLTFGWLHQGMRSTRVERVPFLFLDITGVAADDQRRSAQFGDQWVSATFADLLAAFGEEAPRHVSDAHLRSLLAQL